MNVVDRSQAIEKVALDDQQRSPLVDFIQTTEGGFFGSLKARSP
jgi:hypothetical protein